MSMHFIKTTILILSFASLTICAGSAQSPKSLPEFQYCGYRVVHHLGVQIEHMETVGFNTFEHPPIADHRSFVITPALDHFYSKAVADVRWGPVVIDTPAKDDRYSSIEIFCQEHFAIYDKILGKEGERFVLVHEDFKGKLPEGTVIKTKSNFPFVFLRTQSFAFNDDKLANSIRRQARIHGAWQDVDLPNPKDPQAVIRWSIENSNPYPQTKALMAKAAAGYAAPVHKETFEDLKAFLASGGVSGNVGMFEAVDHPDGGTQKVRAAGTLLGHLGFPVHHAYYQQIPVDSKGALLSGANGPFTVTVPYKPGVEEFWSVTRYGSNTFVPLNPADIGGNDIQAYNAFNTRPDAKGNVTFTFSKADPKDGTYWMPVADAGYYLIFRYYAPTKELNGNTAKDLVYGGTSLAKKFETVKFK